MRPEPGQVLHFSEDPTITVFEPHVAATAKHAEPYVWAVDHDRAPDYWFPRKCPRAMAWAEESTTEDDRLRIIGDEQRVHAVEYGWLEAMRTVELYAYRLPADHFESFGGYCHVSTRTVRPLGRPERVGDLFAQGLSRNGRVVLAAIGCGGTASAYGLIETIPFAGGRPTVIVRGPCRASSNF